MVKDLAQCDRCKREVYYVHLNLYGKKKLCPYCDGRMDIKETDLMKRAKKRALKMANKVGN